MLSIGVVVADSRASRLQRDAPRTSRGIANLFEYVRFDVDSSGGFFPEGNLWRLRCSHSQSRPCLARRWMLLVELLTEEEEEEEKEGLHAEGNVEP